MARLARFVVRGRGCILLQAFGKEEHAVDVPIHVRFERLDDLALAREIDGVEAVRLPGVLEPELFCFAGDFQVPRVASEVVVQEAVHPDAAPLIPVNLVIAQARAVVIERGHEPAEPVVDSVGGPERELDVEELAAVGVAELFEVVAAELIAGFGIALGDRGFTPPGRRRQPGHAGACRGEEATAIRAGHILKDDLTGQLPAASQPGSPAPRHTAA